MNNRIFCSIILLLIIGFPVSLCAQETSTWTDPSPHSVQFITVDEDVRLEVLDWGGSGRPVVLLAGGGNTAHVYDDFAPKLTSDYHVYGITRRGYGASSQPESGYDSDRRGDDVKAVLDELNLMRPVLAGHSRAGQEMSSVASRYPDRVAGLIYIDAYQSAFDFKPEPDIMEKMPNSPPPMPPRPNVEDFSSVSAYIIWSERIQGFSMPEAEYRQLNVISSDGRLIGPRTPSTITQSIRTTRMTHEVDIRVPVLAIISPSSAQAPWIKEAEPKVQEEVAALVASSAAFRDNMVKQFKKAIPSARIVRLPGARHYMFITNETEVLREMRGFLEKLP